MTQIGDPIYEIIQVFIIDQQNFIVIKKYDAYINDIRLHGMSLEDSEFVNADFDGIDQIVFSTTDCKIGVH